MRNIIILTIFCVTLATVLAIPTPLSTSSVVAASRNGIRREGAMSEVVLAKFSMQQYTPFDWFSDLITAMLGVEVAELLTTINNTLKQLYNLVRLGVEQLQSVMNSVDPVIRAEIQALINGALADSGTVISPIVDDLGLVLPQITKRTLIETKGDASDIILALLGISLEEFLNKVSRALEQSDQLLTATMTKLDAIADNIQNSNPSAAAQIRVASEQSLEAGKDAIRPILDSLYKVLVFKNKMNSRGEMDSGVEKQSLFAEVISTILGFDIVEAGIQLELTLVELEAIVVSHFTRLNRIFSNSEEAQNDVNLIINNHIREIRSTLRPIKNVLLQFVPEDAEEKDVTIGFVESILGVSLENFLKYVDFTSYRLEEILTETMEETETLANNTGLWKYRAVKRLNQKSTEDAERVVQPLLEIISQILPGDRQWVTTEEFINHIESPKYSENSKVFCDFSLSMGQNTDFIINITSSILGFNLVDAVVELDNVLGKLDELLHMSMEDLHTIIEESHYLQNQTSIEGIFQKAVNDSQITIRPVLDIFVEFLPNQTRLQKDIMNGIIQTISGVTSNELVNYMAYASGHFETIIKNAVEDINRIMENAESNIASKVHKLLERTINSAEEIIQPFKEIVVSIILPAPEPRRTNF